MPSITTRRISIHVTTTYFASEGCETSSESHQFACQEKDMGRRQFLKLWKLLQKALFPYYIQFQAEMLCTFSWEQASKHIRNLQLSKQTGQTAHHIYRADDESQCLS